MALIRMAGFYSGVVGAEETILLFAEHSLIVSATYFDEAGKPLSLTVPSQGSKSITVKVVQELHPIQITILSFDPSSEWTTLYQGDLPNGSLIDIPVTNHKGTGGFKILGIAAAASDVTTPAQGKVTP